MSTATNTTKRYVHLYTESVPNPTSMKFAVNFMVVPEGVDLDFETKAAAEAKSPLATALFGFEGVQRVFLMSNFITMASNRNTALGFQFELCTEFGL